MTSTSRRLRAFKRWMKSQSIDYSDALEFIDSPDQGIAVKAACDLKEGDVVATIPKRACLTIMTSAAREVIEAAGLDGVLGLSVAIMYERSLGEDSDWAGYLQVLPERESLPLVWSMDEIDELLRGTELHKTVKEDKGLVYEDWNESILPLLDSGPLKLNHDFFGIEQYFSAKSLIASRSFQIDDYHGSGMVPLADLFNHKTGAEDVHFTHVSSHSESESDEEDNRSNTDNNVDGDDQSTSDSVKSESAFPSAGNVSDADVEVEAPADDTVVLEMIMIKDVKSGNEVFNTYGSLGNAALLHRYGFTEEGNPYDIVNMDLELVKQWSSSLFSNRYVRARVSLWRTLGYTGCTGDDSDYFEISFNGEPQLELLLLLYILLLPEDTYDQLNIAVSTEGECNLGTILLAEKDSSSTSENDTTLELTQDLLLTETVCNALSSLADMRESLYGSHTMEDDLKALARCCSIKERKLYHSLMLRVSERTILKKLRNYASVALAATSVKPKNPPARKKMKRG